MSDRDYQINGIAVPGVTTIAGIFDKPGLNKWREKMGTTEADAEAQRTAERGNKIHRNALLLCRGDLVLPDEDELVNLCTTNLRPWVATYVVETLLAEQPIYCRARYFAGRPDLVAIMRWVDGEFLSVIDWKGSRAAKAYYEWDLQTAGYSLCDEVEELARASGISPATVRRATITMNPEADGLPTVWSYGQTAIRRNAFLYALCVYQDKTGWAPPRPSATL